MSRLTLCLLPAIGFCAVLVAAADDPAELSPPFAGSETGEAWSGNSHNIEFLWVEPGRFVMGSPQDESERSEDEEQVEVTLTEGFWLGKYEVTQEQWKKVMQTEPWANKGRVRVASDSPACWLSWDQASLFCRELTRQEQQAGTLPEGWEYVLPTEAQWEYACRAGTTTKYSFGDDDDMLFDYAWYGEQHREPKEMRARAVGRKLPNPWGFYDMHGNVVEWCRDWYNPQYPGGTDPYVGTDFNNRVTARGGEWRIELRWSRSACRQSLLPSGGGATIGLRLSLQRGSTTRSSPSPTVRLAVVSFENRGRSVAHSRFGPALAGMVASDLAGFAELEVLERQSAKNLTQESALSRSGLTQDGAADSRKAAATYILTGACSITGNKLSVTAQLARPGFAKPVAEWNLDGAVDDLFRLERQLISGVVAALKIKPDRRPAPPPLRGAAPVLAILPLVNNSATARLDDMQTAFAELLQASLGEYAGVRLVERQKLDTIVAEQKLSLSGLVDPETAAQVGKLAGAQRLLTGSFLELGDELNLQVRIVDTATGGIVASAKATRASEEFGKLIDDLVTQIVSSLAVPAPIDSERRGESPLVGRTLESTIYRNAGDRYRNEGNLTKAVEAYQQALLIEPYKISIYRRLINTQLELDDYAGAIRTGERALQQSAEFKRHIYKPTLLSPLVHAYQRTGRLDAIEGILTRYGDISDDFRFSTTKSLADGLIKRKRFSEADALMVRMAEQDVAKHGVLKSEGLRRLFWFHHFHSTSIVGIPIKVHQEQAGKAIAVYERVLDAATGVRDDEDAVKWARMVIPHAVELITISDDNQRVPFLSPVQQAAYRNREGEVFGWLPDVGLKTAWETAVASERMASWNAALDAYRRVLELSDGISVQWVRPTYFREDWINKRIEAQYRIGRILGFELQREDEAREAFETLVRDYGLSHQAGPDARVAMHQLRMDARIPPDAALVWGGSASNLNGWEIMLRSANLRMHALRSGRSPAALAPYRLVIVNRSNGAPLMPSDVLALRTYVAAGGSILVIASPMWHAAGAVAVNSLLSLFDMEADVGSLGNARSTEIVPHPITEGISEFTAQQAAGLRAPPESLLVRVGDKGLLAAREYGRGRVVVATIGQWHTPEILLAPAITEAPPRRFIDSGQNSENYEYIRGLSPEPPLLRQALHWLREPRERDESFAEWRQEWQAAARSFLQAQARIMPPDERIVEWDDVPQIFDRLVANAPNAELRELSLWTAGECALESGYYNWGASPLGYRAQRSPLSWPRASRRLHDVSLLTETRFFKRLVDDFRDSPLRAFAQYRLAYAESVQRNPYSDRNFGPKVSELVRSLAAPFEEFELQPGTLPHAWAKLDAGGLYFVIDDIERAADHFEEVVESMPVSAEKAVAVLNLVKCRLMQADERGANRLLAQVDGLPSFNCVGGYRHFLVRVSSRFVHDNVRGDLRVLSRHMRANIPHLKADKEFQQWLKERKQRASTKRD